MAPRLTTASPGSLADLERRVLDRMPVARLAAAIELESLEVVSFTPAVALA